MAPIVVYDACVLFPATLRDLMLRLAAAGLVQPRWSARILDECFRNIRLKRPELVEAALERTRAKMCAAFPDAMEASEDPLAAGTTLPDPNDVHVLATALAAGASSIVTFNLRDFPAGVLGPLGIQPMHPTTSCSLESRRRPGSCARSWKARRSPSGTRRPARASSLLGCLDRGSRVPRRESPTFLVQPTDWRDRGLPHAHQPQFRGQAPDGGPGGAW